MSSKINPRQIKQSGAEDGQALVWDEATGAWKPGSVASAATSDGWVVPATGTGASQNVPLPRPVLATDLHVYVNGIRQWIGNYSTSGTTLTLNAPPGALILAELPRGAPGRDGVDALGVPDAASDDRLYARQNGEWHEAAARAFADELIASRGDRSNLSLRISTISNFASPNAGGIVIGNYYDNAFQGTGSATLAGAANRVDLAPFFTSQRLKIDRIGCRVNAAVAGALVKIVIYESDETGWARELLFESTDLDAATTGGKEVALDFTFDSGRQYWLGLRHNSTATMSTINVSSAVNLGVNGLNGTAYFTILRRTISYASPAPALWGFVPAQLVSNVSPPSIRMRAAA